MAHDVFISHSVKDKVTADAVCALLESEGVRCWIAPRDVMPGMEWGECIIEAIEQTRVMVLVFTADANASPQIRREVERAVNHGVAILPVRRTAGTAQIPEASERQETRRARGVACGMRGSR